MKHSSPLARGTKVKKQGADWVRASANCVRNEGAGVRWEGEKNGCARILELRQGEGLSRT